MNADKPEPVPTDLTVAAGESSPRQTASEEYLFRLGQQAFLSLWAHPNVFTDEGKKPGKGVGKELCDLLVVFGDDVIIFSDKHVEFKSTGNLQVDWKRWYRRAVGKSVGQLFGAKGWLERFPDRLFLDPACRTRFPIALPPPDRIRFHLVAVTTGSYRACADFFGGNSLGSLRISTPPDSEDVPFTLGRVGGTRGFVHVFDEFTLDAVLRELDTVSDFVTYLHRKELFLGNPQRQIVAPGEEQLLAIYMTNLGPDGEHDFVLPGHKPGNPEPDIAFLDENFWDAMVHDPMFLAKKAADRASYAWDTLISRFIKYGLPRPEQAALQDWSENQEQALRHMARESRLHRRLLGQSLVEFLQKAPTDRALARVVHTGAETAYVYLAEPFKSDFESYEEYQRYRIARVYAYCTVAPLRAPGAQRVVGLAFDSPGSKGGSEDLVVWEFQNFDDTLRAQAEETQRQLGILLQDNVQSSEMGQDEFPGPGPAAPAVGRREPVQPPRGSATLNREQRRALDKRNRRRQRW